MASKAEATPRRGVAADKVAYDDLYARWEQGNWSATEIDLTSDAAQWSEEFTELERRAALWNYAMFFHGEDLVADHLSPFIDAAPREEQKYFLATQQVDEARHAVFFGRFMREVAHSPENVGQSLEWSRPQLSWGFRKTFAKLDSVATDLRKDRSRPNLARAICLYHLVVEATLAQTGQDFIEAYLTASDRLPGFRAGLRNVARDEQRHIAFGVRMLSDLSAEDPDCRAAVADLLREVTPFSAAVFVPPGFDRRYTEIFGKSIEDIFEQGVRSLDQKLRSAGLAVETLPGPQVFPLGLGPRARAERVVALLAAGIMGEKTGPPSRDSATVALLFDTIRRSLDTSRLDREVTIQWDFRDQDPWFVRASRESQTAARGRLENPDVTLRVEYEDWVDIVARRKNPRLALLTGRLRVRGSIGALRRFQRMFPR